MRSLRFLALVSAVSLVGAALPAQQVQQLPRVTPTTGLADSSLFLCVDSTKTLTRACKFSDVQKRLAFKSFDSLVTGNIRVTGTCTGCGAGGGGATVSDTVKLVTFDSVHAIRTRTDTLRSNGGASKRLVLQTTTSGSAATTAARFNELQQSLHADGLVATPSIGFAADSLLGFYRHGTAGANDTLALSTNGINTLNFTGGASATILGGAGSMVIQGGTGNSRAIDLQTTNQVGTAKTALHAGNSGTNKQFLQLMGDTVTFLTPGLTTGPDLIRGGASNMTLLAGTGASRTLTLQATNAGSVAVNSLVVQDSTVLVPAGRVGQPGIALTGFATTGLFHPAGGGISVGAAGTESMNFTNSSVTSLQRFTVPIGSSTNPGLLFQSQNFTGLYAVGNGSTTDSVGISSDAVKTLTIGGGANAGLVGGAGNMTILAGTGNSRTMTLQSTTSAGAAKNTLVLGADSSATFLGTVRAPIQQTCAQLSFVGANCTGLGLVSNGDTLYAGVQNARTFLFTSTGRLRATGQGVAGSPSYSWAIPGGTTTGFYYVPADTIGISTGGSTRLLIANQGATGAGDVALCVKTTGVVGVITQGATCGSSSAKVKTQIGSIFDPVAKTMALRPVSYSYIPGVYGGRHEYGLIADSTMRVDSTLVFRAEHDDKLPDGQVIRKGDALNVNDRAVLSLLLATVQKQQRQLDSIKNVLRERKP